MSNAAVRERVLPTEDPAFLVVFRPVDLAAGKAPIKNYDSVARLSPTDTQSATQTIIAANTTKMIKVMMMCKAASLKFTDDRQGDGSGGSTILLLCLVQ